MANRNFRSQFQYSYVKEPVDLNVRVSFGASGAPTTVSGTGMGIASIARVSAGVYDITLQNSYAALLGIRHTFIKATAPSSPSLYVSSDASATLAAPIIRVVFNAAGTATDPASGELVLMKIELANSPLAY